MSFLGAIAKRNRRVEMMDDPLLANEQHIRALGGLARLNAVSLSTRNFWGPIAELGRRNGTRRLRVLDVATGAGDVPLGLLRKARGTRLELEAHGIDVSGRAVRFAQQRAAASRMRMDFSTRDALHGDLPSGFDVVMSSLFLHHLAEEQAVLLLEKMAKAARHLVLVSDLARNLRGLMLAGVVSRLATTSRVVHVDAIRSVRAAFTLPEARRLAEAAGLERATVAARWPCRFLLSWSRP